MVEVFRTNIDDKLEAGHLLKKLQKTFPGYKINFNLEDCDNILRMETKNGIINATPVIDLVKNHGFEIEVLPDIPVTKRILIK